MAASNVPDPVDGLSKCSICFENKNEQLRKLPTCKHSFCEGCIRHHFSCSKVDTESENERRSSFLCPVCRCSNDCPQDTERFVNWIKTLDVDGEMSLEPDETSENMGLCFLCRKLEQSSRVVNSSRAVKHCMECQENYCEACCDLFHSLNFLKDHSFFELKSDQRDAHGVQQKLQEYFACPAHAGKTLNCLCEDDDKLCCQTCAFVDHRKCKRVKELGNRGTRDNLDKEARKLTEYINELTSYGQTVIETIKGNKTEYQTKAEGIDQTIREARAKINEVFDALEENSTQACRALVKKYVLSDDMKIQTVQEIVDKLVECCSFLEEMKQKDSIVLMHVLLHKLKKEFYRHETALLEIIPDFRKAGFELQLQKLLNDFVELNVNETDKLAVVNENEDSLSLPTYNRRQLLKFSNINKIGTHRIIACGSLDSFPRYCNLICLPKNQLMLVDEGQGLCCLTNDKYNPISSCNFTTHKITDREKDVSKNPFSATHLKDNIVLVSVPARKELYFLRVGEELAIVGIASTLHTPKGLHVLINGDIAVSWNDPVAFGILSLDCFCLQERTYFTHDQSGRVLKTFDYMAVDERRSHVIQPCTTDKAVYCFDFKGNPKFNYTHRSLKKPRGVALDNDGNIYVCDQLENCIHVLTAYGTPVRRFREGCPKQPLAITFDRTGTSFIVSQTGLSGGQRTIKCVEVNRYSMC